MTADEIYAQQKALEAQILSLGHLVKDHEQITTSAPNPLCDSIMREKERNRNSDQVIPNLEYYYGDACPVGHLTRFNSKMDSKGMSDHTKALTFSSTLFGVAMD